MLILNAQSPISLERSQSLEAFRSRACSSGERNKVSWASSSSRQRTLSRTAAQRRGLQCCRLTFLLRRKVNWLARLPGSLRASSLLHAAERPHSPKRKNARAGFLLRRALKTEKRELVANAGAAETEGRCEHHATGDRRKHEGGGLGNNRDVHADVGCCRTQGGLFVPGEDVVE